MKYCSKCGQLVPEPDHGCDPDQIKRWLAFAKEHKPENDAPGLIPMEVLIKSIGMSRR